MTARGRVPAAERREAILDALEHILSTTALLDVQIKQVARVAGCKTATFYQHFDDLTAAAAALVERERAQAGDEPIADPHLAALAQLLTVEQALPAAV